MHRWIYSAALLLTTTLMGCDNVAHSERDAASSSKRDVQTFSLGITHDLVNLPWRMADRRGLLAKIERRHQIRLDVVEFTNERRALQAYNNGDIDALTVSLNAMISSLEVSRHETHIPLIFGFSRADYGIFSREISKPSQLAQQKIHVPLGSSGHYLLFRILEFNQLSLGDVTLIDTPEESLIQDFITGEINTLVASGSTFAQLRQLQDVSLIADSRSLFGEIVSGVAIDSTVINQHPELAEMLVQSWFMIMREFFSNGGDLLPNNTDVLIQLSNLPSAQLNRYLGAHNFLRLPQHALQFMQGDNLQPALLGTRRFREAASIYQCTPSPVDACFIERNDNVITNGEGSQIRLDTRFLEEMLRTE